MAKQSKSDPNYKTGIIRKDTVDSHNNVLKRIALESFLIRMPRLLLHAHFHYHLSPVAGFSISDHAHWEWEISRIVRGSATYETDLCGHPVCPDASSYLIIPPKTLHRWHVSKKPLFAHSWQVYIKAEDPEGEQALERLRQIAIEHDFVFAASQDQLQAEESIWNLTGRSDNISVRGSILSGIASVVLGDLLMRMNPWPDGLLDTAQDTEVQAAKLAVRVKSFLDENLCRSISLSDVESHFHFSGRHLNRAFQKNYHCPIGQYLQHQRIELAKSWLGATGRSVKDIAFSIGYSGSRQFSRYFLEQTGMTPTQYRDARPTSV